MSRRLFAKLASFSVLGVLGIFGFKKLNISSEEKKIDDGEISVPKEKPATWRLAYIHLLANVDVNCRLTINGLPLLAGPSLAEAEWSEILDLWMLKSNKLEIQIDGDPDTEIIVKLRLSLHRDWVAPNTGEAMPIQLQQDEAGVLSQLQDDGSGVFTLKGKGSIKATGSFVTHGPDFTTTLRPSRKIAPTEAMSVAESALKSLASGQTESVVALMAHRLTDIAKVMVDDPKNVRTHYLASLSEVSAFEALRTSPPKLTTIQYGPLIEVRADGGALFRSADGSLEVTAIFGWTDSGIGIVR